MNVAFKELAGARLLQGLRARKVEGRARWRLHNSFQYPLAFNKSYVADDGVSNTID